MIRLLVFQSGLLWCATAVGQTGRIHFRVPLEREVFSSCSDVEEKSLNFKPVIVDKVYSVELLPKDAVTFITPFLSDVSITQIPRWIASNKDRLFPFAMLYVIDDKYEFRCRNNKNQLIERSGPGGSPMTLKIRDWEARILHFDINERGVADVYVVTNAPLESVSEMEVLNQVTQRLRARSVGLYIRNDPWFFGYAMDSAPFIFTDLSHVIDVESYRATKTIDCMTLTGCNIGPSWGNF